MYADLKFVVTMKFSILPNADAVVNLSNAQLASIGVRICALVFAGLRIAQVLASGMMANASVFAQNKLLEKIAQLKTNTGTMSAANAFALLTILMDKITLANSGTLVLAIGSVSLKIAQLANTGR